MTLDKFEYVLALAEEKSLTKAAKRLFISQPGLTSYINKLEEYLGVKLFDRSVTPIEVTDAGMIYISRMKNIQNDEESLRMKLKDMYSEKRIFRIGIGMTRGLQWLPKILPDFYFRHPEVVIHIHEGGLEKLENGVSMGNYDIAFGALNTGYPGVKYVELAKEQIYCVAPRSMKQFKYLKTDEATITSPMKMDSRLFQNMLFFLPSPENGMFRFTNHVMKQNNIVPASTINMNIMETAYQLAGNGMGALFVNAEDMHRVYPEYDDKLVFFYLEDLSAKRISSVGFKEDSPNIDLIEDLIRIVKKNIYNMEI